MSAQRIFSLFCGFFGVMAFIGSLQHPMTSTVSLGVTTVGRGFFPLVYSIALLVFSTLLFFSNKNQKKVDFRASMQGSGGKAVVFFLLNFVAIFLFFMFGSFIAVLIFSILACIALKRLIGMRKIIVFSICFTAAFYLVFVTIFQMPFQRGLIFELLGWYI